MLAVVDNCAGVCNFNTGKYLLYQPINKSFVPVSALWSQQVGCLPAGRGKPSRSHFGAYALKTNNKIQEKVMKSFIKSLMLIVAMLAMVGAVYAVFPENPSEGDYWYNRMTLHGNFAATAGWQRYNGAAWVDATTAVTNQQQPFTKNIYLSNTAILKDNFTLAGNIISNTDDPDRNIRFTVNGDCTFNLTNTGTVTVHSVLIEDNATFINKGTVNLPYTDDASEFYVETGSGNQTGGHLDNYGTINVNGRFRFGYEASIISREGGIIQGPGRMQTEAGGATAGDYRLSIANAGGWDAAFNLTGGYDTAPISYYFIGETDQVTGVNMPQPIYNMTVESGHTLTLSKQIELRGRNNPYNERPNVTVKSGSTLNTGTHIIKSNETGILAASKFILEPGATIKTAHPQGISSEKSGRIINKGAIQLNNAEYSSGADYIFSATTSERQFSGCFDTTPTANTVRNITNTNPVMLNLCPDFRPLHVTDYTGLFNHDDTILTEGYIDPKTLPVTLSYFNAVFNGFDSVTLQWETQTETNNLGFYILRSVEPDAAQANIVSELIPAANSSQGASYYFEDKSLYDDGLYYYWLQDVSFAGAVELHGPAMAQVSLNAGGNHSPDIPLKTGFTRCFPNPFNPSTQLEYYLENSSDVSFEVYNLKGQLVDQISLRNQASGFNRYTWEPQLSSGVYLIRFAAGGKSNTRRVVLTK